MERVAIGFCHLSPDYERHFSPRDLQWRYEAEIERENREFDRIAQLACWVINPWLGSNATKLRARDLLPRRPAKPEKDWWDEE